jgi:hypothetical protein
MINARKILEALAFFDPISAGLRDLPEAALPLAILLGTVLEQAKENCRHEQSNSPVGAVHVEPASISANQYRVRMPFLLR